MEYDYIFIGGSICNLLLASKIASNMSTKILIIEKDKYLGGAWRIDSDELKNIDMCGHLIVPKDNDGGNLIIKYLKKLDLDMNHVTSNKFFYETENWRSNDKQGIPLICNNGWTDFNIKIVNYVKKINNIHIVTNYEVKHILCLENAFEITSNDNDDNNDNNDNMFLTQKIIIPMYCNIKKLYSKINSNNIIEYDIPYQRIINTHIIIFIKTPKESQLENNFQGFYDKEPIQIFDRVSLSKKDNNGIILSCRLSKNYKKMEKNELNKLFKLFLVEKNIIDPHSSIIKHHYYDYPCCYRGGAERQLLYSNAKKIQNQYLNSNNTIHISNTTYMGHFLQNLVEGNIKI
jgi:hypothetical protein